MPRRGKTLLRVFVGGARRPDLAEMPDAELLPLVLEHLRPLLRIEGEPVFCDIAHWPRTMPQYHVGHQERVARIEARLALLPGLKMAGSAFRGVGLPDCIHGGEQCGGADSGGAKAAAPVRCDGTRVQVVPLRPSTRDVPHGGACI